MAHEETRQKHHDDVDSDAEDDIEEEEEEESIPQVEIDATTLTPLSPEVISKQVRAKPCFCLCSSLLDVFLGHNQLRSRSLLPVDSSSAPLTSPHAGTIGHVAHGKSTVVKAISGVMTVRFKNELVRNITIKLGYANAKVSFSQANHAPRSASYLAGLDIQVRKRRMPAAGLLPLTSFV